MSEAIEKSERDELNDSIVNAQLVRSLLKNKGWTDVVEPLLKQRQSSLMTTMLTSKIPDYQGFVYLQQSINAIDSVFKTLDFLIAQGESAAEKLKDVELV